MCLVCLCFRLFGFCWFGFFRWGRFLFLGRRFSFFRSRRLCFLCWCWFSGFFFLLGRFCFFLLCGGFWCWCCGFRFCFLLHFCDSLVFGKHAVLQVGGNNTCRL